MGEEDVQFRNYHKRPQDLSLQVFMIKTRVITYKGGQFTMCSRFQAFSLNQHVLY